MYIGRSYPADILPAVSLLKQDEYLEFKDIEPCYKCIKVNLRCCITLKVE